MCRAGSERDRMCSCPIVVLMGKEAKMNKLNQNKGQPKKPYMKPEVKQVPLRPEEAMLGSCKHSTLGGGPSHVTCSPLFCFEQGS